MSHNYMKKFKNRNETILELRSMRTLVIDKKKYKGYNVPSWHYTIGHNIPKIIQDFFASVYNYLKEDENTN